MSGRSKCVGTPIQDARLDGRKTVQVRAGNAFIGWHDPSDPTKSYIFMRDVTVMSLYGASGIPVFAHYVFQFAFADCASTICSGAMVGRTRFIGDVLYSIGVSGFIYPIFGHWCWGPDGLLATMGSEGHFLSSLGMNFHDFAGSTVVHSIGGWVAIAGAICLGPRLGRTFKRDGVELTGSFVATTDRRHFDPVATALGITLVA